MVLPSFAQKVVDKVKDFAKNLWLMLKPKAKKALLVGVIVVENMKTFVDSGIPDVIVQLTVGTKIDDFILKRLKEWLPRIVVEMRLVVDCTNLTDPDEIMRCAIKTLNQAKTDWLAEANYGNQLDSLAVLISMIVADGDLDWDDAKQVTKWFYDNYFTPRKATLYALPSAA